MRSGYSVATCAPLAASERFIVANSFLISALVARSDRHPRPVSAVGALLFSERSHDRSEDVIKMNAPRKTADMFTPKELQIIPENTRQVWLPWLLRLQA